MTGPTPARAKDLARGTAALLAMAALHAGAASRASPQDASTAAEQFPFHRAHTIRIVDRWLGLSPTSPHNAEFELRLESGGLRGRALFSVGEGERALLDSAEVSVPAEATSEFLARLATAEVRPGVYEPALIHTDDYPYLSIEIVSEGDTVRFFSASQGSGHAPWAMQHAGEPFIIDSSAPADALTEVQAYLKLERRAKLIRRAREGTGRESI